MKYMTCLFRKNQINKYIIYSDKKYTKLIEVEFNLDSYQAHFIQPILTPYKDKVCHPFSE